MFIEKYQPYVYAYIKYGKNIIDPDNPIVLPYIINGDITIDLDVVGVGYDETTELETAPMFARDDFSWYVMADGMQMPDKQAIISDRNTDEPLLSLSINDSGTLLIHPLITGGVEIQREITVFIYALLGGMPDVVTDDTNLVVGEGAVFFADIGGDGGSSSSGNITTDLVQIRFVRDSDPNGTTRQIPIYVFGGAVDSWEIMPYYFGFIDRTFGMGTGAKTYLIPKNSYISIFPYLDSTPSADISVVVDGTAEFSDNVSATVTASNGKTLTGVIGRFMGDGDARLKLVITENNMI